MPPMGIVVAPPKPRLRGRIHQVAFWISVPSGVVLVALADGAVQTAVASIYAVSLTAVFGASAAYHRGEWSDRAHAWMRRLDHSMIYLLIAGSYTPVTVLILDGPWEAVLLSLAWAGAAVGVTLKLLRPHGLSVTSAILYMGLGWLAMIALPKLLVGMTTAEAVLMIAGGLLYTAGAIVFASKRPDPLPETFGYHEIWHAFIVAAATCHYAMIMLVLRSS
jgi:hemolysin III